MKLTLSEQRDTPRNLREQIDWLCRTLGLQHGRDDIMQKLVQTLLYEMAKQKEAPTSERLSQLLAAEQQRVNYHLRTLIETGLVEREKKRIRLREPTLAANLRELQRRVNALLEKSIKTAEEIDRQLGLE